MGAGRGHHGYCLDVFIGEQLMVSRVPTRDAELGRKCFAQSRLLIGNRDQRRPRHSLRKVLAVHAAHSAQTDQPDPQPLRWHQLLLFCAARCRTTSTHTAATITTPITTVCQAADTLSRLRPLRRTPIISAPTKVPLTVPTPPKKLAPPMTTAAIESSSAPTPAKGNPEFMRPARMIAPAAAVKPLSA